MVIKGKSEYIKTFFPDKARPAAKFIVSCSATPVLINLSGNFFLKICYHILY